MPACLICESSFDCFLDFGPMPIANGFLTPQEFAAEHFFELQVGYCPVCTMVQLGSLVEREKMFHAGYPFFTASSGAMVRHFAELAGSVTRDYLSGPDPLVVEIGSNDGTFLQNFSARGIRHLGFEPSANVAAVARDRGIQTEAVFFDQQAAARAVQAHGRADVFVGANVMCHIPYLHSVLSGIVLLLKPQGVVVFEDPYLGDILEKTAYDQIYDEHAFYFSLSSVESLFGRHGMEVVDVRPQPVHGGSMRYVLAFRGARPASDRVAALRRTEEAAGLRRPETYREFRRRVEKSRDDLVGLLRSIRQAGQRVVGYAATSKSTTVINYCGLGPDLIDFISDTTPIKQGRFSPGAHIPVRPHEEFAARYPPYALLFAWNHAQEIFAREEAFRQAGGRWITYVPRVQILD